MSFRSASPSWKMRSRTLPPASFFLPKAFTNPNWLERPDPAPFVTKMLQDLGFVDQTGKEKPAELDKYLIVAEARVKQAETSLESTRVRRETLEKMLKRVDEAGPKAGFPQNQIDLMRRDVALMKLEEDRLTETLKVLNDNVNAVKSGNLIYESKLLQRFDAEPTRSLGTTRRARCSTDGCGAKSFCPSPGPSVFPGGRC